MSTPFYDLASLVVVPSGYKSGKIYAQKPLTTDGQLTFTRASTATRVNASGLIETVASGVPRLDYLGSSCPKLNLEPQRTNSLTYSEQFDMWSYGGATITTNNAISPDGTTSADLLTADGTTGQHYVTKSNAQNAKTISFFIKMGTQRYVQILTSGTVDALANYDLQTGNVGGLGADSTASMVNYGNGWWRIILTSTDVLTGDPYLCFVDSLTSGRFPSFASSGTIWVWGAMSEIGATYATSYIPTTSAAVTRLEDECEKTSISSLIGQAEGTLFIEATLTHSAASNEYLLQVSANGSNRFFIYRESSSNKLGCFALIGSSPIYTQLTAAAITGTVKAAFAYKSGSFSFYVNGVQVGTSSATFTTPPTMARLDIDANSSGENGYYNYGQMLLFKTRLTNAQLAELTTL
jgi:hypothetical protein